MQIANLALVLLQFDTVAQVKRIVALVLNDPLHVSFELLDSLPPQLILCGRPAQIALYLPLVLCFFRWGRVFWHDGQAESRLYLCTFLCLFFFLDFRVSGQKVIFDADGLLDFSVLLCLLLEEDPLEVVRLDFLEVGASNQRPCQNVRPEERVLPQNGEKSLPWDHDRFDQVLDLIACE